MTASDAVRRLFDGYTRDGVDGALVALSPDAALVVGPETSAEPDTYEGVQGGRRYFAAFDGALDDVRFELADIHYESGEALIGSVTLSGVGAATRIPVKQSVLMSFTVRDGLITRLVSHPTMEAARAEVGLSPE
jgi:ketosteroid isomerase-like protein